MIVSCRIFCALTSLPLTEIKVNSDVYEHLMSSRMALLPEPDIVAKVESLLRHNFDECSMQERTHFLEVCRVFAQSAVT